MNLIITPTYKAWDYVKEHCETLDKNAYYPFFHILVDDNSGEVPPIEVTENRHIIMLKSDPKDKKHEMQLGTCIDIALNYALNMRIKVEDRRVYRKFDHIFYIETDVMPYKDFDKDLIDISKTLPEDWGTLDVLSVNKEGGTTYPCTVHHRIRAINEDELLDIIPHMDFQCMLINKPMLEKFRFNDVESHWDILISRRVEEFKHYRTRKVKAVHEGGASRDCLPQ